jgi:multidrug efflux pump subunit AcrA (membrane-fusion protein)
VLIGGAFSVTALVLIPWEFELEVPAIAFPVERRSIFAPENGIVDQVRVSEGGMIDAGQSLLILTNSQLSMQLRQVQGERDTVSVRLRAIGIARTAAAAGSEDASELIREELQLQQKLKTLEEEAALLESQLGSLNLKAPISGVVFQRRLHEQLEGRPVQRGQLLLEVGNVEGHWELELKVPATSAGYLPMNWDSDETGNATTIPVRFRTGDADTNSGEARLTSISMAAEIEEGRLICKAYAGIEGHDHALRPGQAVTARVSCGKRSLGFVLFRDVVQFLRRMWFVWT